MAETGYSKGNLKPQAGSLSREFNPAHPCYFNITDSESDYITVSFFGDVTADFEERGLKIDGLEYPLDSASYDSEANRTTLNFLRGSFLYEDSETYEVEFAETSVEPIPSWTIAPSISGTPQVGQTLTGNPGTVINGTVTSRVWLRDDVVISGATGSSYTLVEADEDAYIKFQPTATGSGGTASATSAAVGPVEAAIPVEPSDNLFVKWNEVLRQFEITNLSDFPGAAIEWKDENGDVIAGQTGATMPFSAAPDGLAVRAVPDEDDNAASALVLGTLDMIEFDERFDGAPAGTPLNGYNGWAAITGSSGNPTNASDTLVTIEGDGVYISGRGGTIFFVKELTPGPKRVTIYDFNHSLSSETLFNRSRTLRVFHSPLSGDNFARISTNSNNLSSGKRVGGADTSFDNQLGEVSGDRESMAIQVIGGRLRSFVDGVETSASVSAGGWDVSDVPETGYLYIDPRLYSYPTGDTQSYRQFSRVLVEDLSSQTFVLDEYTTEEGGIGERTTHIYTGRILGDPTHFDWCVLDENGVQIKPWVENVEVTTPGEWEIVTEFSDDVEGRNNARIAIRETNDYSVLSVLAIPQIEAFYVRYETGFGFHSGNVNGSSADDLFTDRAKTAPSWGYFSGSWKYDFPRKLNGTPDFNNAPAYDWVALKLWEGGAVGASRAGVYTASWEMEGVTAGWTSLSGGAVAGVIDDVNKTAKITIPEGTPVAALRFFTTGPVSEDWVVTCTRDAETSTGPMNDAALAMLQDAHCFRFMKAQGVESPYSEVPTTTGLRIPARATPEFISECANQMDTRPYFCMPVNDNDAYVYDFAERMKVAIEPGRELLIAYGNEIPWNTVYGPATNVLYRRTLEDGFVPGVPEGLTWVVPVEYEDRFYGGGQVRREIPAGSYVYTGSSDDDLAIYAKQTIPVGSPLTYQSPGYEDAVMKVYAREGTTNGVRGSSNLFSAHRIARIGEIFREVFEDQNPISPILEVQIGTGSDDVVDRLTYRNNQGKGIKYIAPSHYNGSINFTWTGDYVAPAWMKDVSDANDAAWNEGMLAIHLASNINTVNNIAKLLDLKKKLRGLGWSPDEIPEICTYEGGNHWRLDGVPSEYRADLLNRKISWMSSDECYEAEYDLMERVAALGVPFVTPFGLAWYDGLRENNDVFGYTRNMTPNLVGPGLIDMRYKARLDFLAARAAP